MAARTGKNYLAGLDDGREVWVDGECVRDVVRHPSLSGAAHTLAGLFDLHYEAADVCLTADPESGEPIAGSHVIPRSLDDLRRRHACLQRVAEATVGLMGRTPDYLNVTYAGFAGMVHEWAANENKSGAAKLVEFQRELRRRDLSLTHTIIQPTNDKSEGDVPRPGNDVALRKVGETARGIVVRGARVLATLAPFADELVVYPGHPLLEGSEAFALAFAIPIAAPGLRILCRDSYSRPGNADHPLSSRFDEQDAFIVLDDVEVPRERLFIDGNVPVYNSVLRFSWFPNIAQQTMIRAQTKLEFAYGLGCRMAEAINDTSPATAEMLGEIWSYVEFTRAAVVAAEAEARDYGHGVWFPAEGPMNALRAALPRWFPRVNEIIRLIGSHNLLATPGVGEFADPGLRPLIDQHLRGTKDVTADRRVAIFRLAWDFTGSALGSRNEQYERFYLASAARCYQMAHATSPKDRARALVDQFLPPA